MIEKYDLDGFEFSQSYLAFWDKIEKANCLLEYAIDTGRFPEGEGQAGLLLDEQQWRRLARQFGRVFALVVDIRCIDEQSEINQIGSVGDDSLGMLVPASKVVDRNRWVPCAFVNRSIAAARYRRMR